MSKENLISQIKRNTLYQRYKNYYSRIDFYEGKNLINDARQLYKILHPSLENHTILNTSNKITPLNIPFGASPKETIHHLGKPSLILNKNKLIPEHKVFFYRKKPSKYRFLIQIHFLNNILFFIRNEIYSPHTLKIEEKKKITSLICRKYYNKIIDLEENILIAINEGNHFVFTTDDADFSTNYLFQNQYIVEYARKLTARLENNKKKNAESFNNVILKNI